MTAEPVGKTPTGKDFLTQVTKHIADQKFEANVTIPLDEKNLGDARISHFQFKGKIRDRPSILDYWVIQRGDRGATVAVNAAETAPKEAVEEMAPIVKSMTFFPPVAPPQPPMENKKMDSPPVKTEGKQ